MKGLHGVYLVSPGPRPPYHRVADHLWGEGCDIDSDGNGDTPEATDWTELTLELRTAGREGPRVDVDPLDGETLVLWIRSADPGLAERTASYLHARSGGTLARPPARLTGGQALNAPKPY